MDRIAHIWGTPMPYAAGAAWPVRVDQFLEPGVSEAAVHWTQSACVLCSNGCGLDIGVHDGRIVGVRGRAEDRVNHGRLGPKGLFGWQANNSRERLTRPMVRRDGQLEPVTWDEAMALLVERSQQVLSEQGPLGMGFYGSGQLFTEDYYTLAVVVSRRHRDAAPGCEHRRRRPASR
jgi:ferredoxin-nitrate reductase